MSVGGIEEIEVIFDIQKYILMLSGVCVGTLNPLNRIVWGVAVQEITQYAS